MGRTFDKGVLVGVALVVALLVGCAGVAYRTTLQLRDDAEWAAHTRRVLDLAGGVLGTMVDAETGQRGYLVTGDEAFLEPYHLALARWGRQLRALHDETRDDPRRQVRVRELESLTAEQLAFLKRGIELRRTSAAAAQAFTAAGQGRAKMDATRRLVAALQDEEHALLRDREQQTADAYRALAATALTSVVAGLAGLGFLIYGIRRGGRTPAAPASDTGAPPPGTSEKVSARLLREEQTARQAAEEAERQVRASEERLRLFVEHTPAAVAMLDRDMRYLLVSRRRLRDFGLEGQDVIGRSYYEVFPNVSERWKEIHRRCLAGASERCEEDRFVRPDGQEVWLRWEICPWRDPRGEIGGLLIFSEVITDRKREQQALRDSEQRFTRFMDHLPGLAWIKDLQGRYAYANDAAVDAFRVPRAGLYGKTDDEVFPPETAAQFRENDRRALAGGAGVQVVETLEGADGVLHHSLVSKFPIPGPDGRAALVGGMAIDVTDRLRAEEALREADRRKDEFLATLAHELRNPLAPIRNALHIMTLPGVDAAALGRMREMMERQVRHMTRMVEDLLDVSRITRGKVELRKEVVDLAAVVGRTVEAARPLTQDRRQEVTVDLPPEPVRLEADPTRLEQVLANLLNNAAKYTDPGGSVRLTARREGGELVIRVRDTGVGIAADMLPRVFEPFVQADRVLHQSQGGLGIGLTLVRRLVEMHGGSVTAHSEGPGRGSEFVVRLPLGKGEGGRVKDEPGSAPVHPSSAPLHPSERILVVDDNVDAAESLALLLRMGGHEVRVAHDGPAALAAVEADPPGLVFLDIGMPVMSGYDVARRLRERPGPDRLLLVAMTGWGQEEARRRSREAGFDHHLVKPVDPETLRQLLARPR